MMRVKQRRSLLLMSFFWFGLVQSSYSNISSVEINALHDIYNSLDGPNWWYNFNDDNLSPWNFSSSYPNPCVENWVGIQCQLNKKLNETYVATLDFRAIHDINGTLPSSIGNFSQMLSFDMSKIPGLYGTIPPEIGNLQYLQYLTIEETGLSGQIPPEMGNLTALRTLYLYFNTKLLSSLPAELGNMKSMQYFNVFGNPLIYGTIPAEFSKMTNLKQFELYGQNMSGTLPPELAAWHKMQVFMVSTNHFSGTFPIEYKNWTQIYEITMDNNHFHGSLSPELFTNWTKLGYLYMDNNKLTGTLPEQLFSNCPKLYTITANDNLFHGSIPDSIGTLVQLQQFSLISNRFTGSLPESIGKCVELSIFTTSNNHFTSSIPISIQNLTELSQLQFDNNLLTGSIPPLMFFLPRLSIFYVFDNHLSGSLPEFNSVNLQILQVYNNQITGSIPATINQYRSQLSIFKIDHNFISGSLPQQLEELDSLTSFQINNNFISGHIPESLSVLVNRLLFLFFNDNLLSGTVPSGLSKMQLLKVFLVNNNHLSGTLSPLLSKWLSVQQFFAQNNQFTGTLDGVFNAQLQTALRYIDVSDNEFRGALPVSLFEKSGILSFAAVSNCFDGAIPSEICGAANLSVLALDGLMSARSCQQRFFADWTGIESYGLQDHVIGGVPECLLNMNQLETLHLSGNGLVGHFSSNLTVKQTLSDLSLSHNIFTGEIPHAVRQSAWTNLDLSYNKFGGTLSEHTPMLPANASLSLQVNRLSGVIPVALREARSISVLDGNLFECDETRSELPVNDPETRIYMCGSNTFNYSLYVWLSAVFCVSVFCVVLTYYWQFAEPDSILMTSIVATKLWMAVFAAQTDDLRSLSHIAQFGRFMRALRWCVFLMLCFIVVIMLPTYSALSTAFNTYTFEYAWEVSATYLSGLTATVVLLVVFVWYGLVCFVVFRDQMPTVAADQPKPVQSERVTWTSQLYITLTAMITWNIVLVTGVNVAYVYICHDYSSNIVHITQLFVALFKVTWNSYIVGELFRLTADNSSSHHIILAVFVILFNNIAAPFVATAYVSSNCFYSVFVSPPQVTVSYSYASCVSSSLHGNFSQCYQYDTSQIATTSYNPPFIYSYQCSSTFVTTYSSIYIFMFTIDAFATPALLWLAKLIHGRSIRDEPGVVSNGLDMMLPRILKVQGIESTAGRNSGVENLLPAQYFSFDEFVVRMLNMVAILSTFGVILPPVAVVCAIAVFSATLQTQLLIGRLVTVCPDLLSGVEARCSGTMDMFMNSVWIVVPFTALFYALFLFDTLGDAVGWRAALWAPLLMCSLPLFFRLMYTVRQRVTSIYNNRKYHRDSGVKYERVSDSPHYDQLLENLVGDENDKEVVNKL